MLMVILGAGASYDSDPASPPPPARQDPNKALWRPPLAAGLFDQRFSRIAGTFRACQPLYQPLREADNIEEELERMFAKIDTLPHYRRYLFQLRDYIQYVLHSVTYGWTSSTQRTTNYVTLFSAVRDWVVPQKERACFVTFNYDTLLDQAWEDTLGCSLQTMNSYVPTDESSSVSAPFALIKLHGSINWWRLVRNVLPGPIIDSVDNLLWTNEYEVNSGYLASTEPPGLRAPEPNTAYVPAISIPTATKTDSSFECPPEHMAALKRALPDVTHLLTIGWRGREQHLLKLWKEVLPPDGSASFPPGLKRMLIVAGKPEEAREVQETLRDDGAITCADVRHAGAGFSDFLRSDMLRSFLSA